MIPTRRPIWSTRGAPNASWSRTDRSCAAPEGSLDGLAGQLPQAGPAVRGEFQGPAVAGPHPVEFAEPVEERRAEPSAEVMAALGPVDAVLDQRTPALGHPYAEPVEQRVPFLGHLVPDDAGGPRGRVAAGGLGAGSTVVADDRALVEERFEDGDSGAAGQVVVARTRCSHVVHDTSL